MGYDAAHVLEILFRLRAVYDAAIFLSGKPTGEPHVRDTCTRLVKEAEQLQQSLLSTGYPVPDDWLTVPCDIAIGPPDKNRHCSAWVVVDDRLPTIREQLRKAILRVQSETTSAPPKAADAIAAGEHTINTTAKGVGPRRAKFLEWYESKNSNTFHSHARICEMWNNMAKEQRAAVCPDGCNNVTRDLVVQDVKRAKKERTETCQKPNKKMATKKAKRT